MLLGTAQEPMQTLEGAQGHEEGLPAILQNYEATPRNPLDVVYDMVERAECVGLQ